MVGSRYEVDGSVDALARSVRNLASSLAISRHCRAACATNAAMAGEPKATLAVVNGKVWPPRDGATALAVGGDRIAASGSDRHIRALCGRRTRVVDARGGTILPAFNDAHVHFLQGARSLSELNLQGAETLGEVERRIAAYAARHKGPWVVGRGWFYSAFPGGLPTVELLDRLIPDRPAYIESYDAHTGWANTRALATAGLGSTGVLKESAMLGVARHIPARSSAEDLEALGAGMRLAAEHGIGSIQEAGGGQDQLELWDALRETGELTLRVRLAIAAGPTSLCRARRDRQHAAAARRAQSQPVRDVAAQPRG